MSVRRGLPDLNTQEALHQWRKAVASRDFGNALFGPGGILGDEDIALLSSVGPITSKERLEIVIGARWKWFSRYGDELWAKIQTLDIPPLQIKPRAQGTKGQAQAVAGAQEAEAAISKRARVTLGLLRHADQQGPTALTPRSLQTPPRRQILTTPSPSPLSTGLARNLYAYLASASYHSTSPSHSPCSAHYRPYAPSVPPVQHPYRPATSEIPHPGFHSLQNTPSHIPTHTPGPPDHSPNDFEPSPHSYYSV
jgi:hypothetical protein